MAWYSYPNNFTIDGANKSVTGLGSLIQYANEGVNGFLGVGILSLIFLLTFGFSLASGTKKALLVSSFISFIMSIFLVRMGILHLMFPIILIVFVIIGAIMPEGGNNSL